MDYGFHHSLADSSIFLHWSILVSSLGLSFLCNQRFKNHICCYLQQFMHSINIFVSGVLLSLSAPLVYDKYQDPIDEKLCVTHRYVQMQYRKLDENVLRKLPLPLNKEKKMQ